MATEAAWLEFEETTGGRRKTGLTHTGLLMEGVSLPLPGGNDGGKVFAIVQTPAVVAASIVPG
jgi:hypothetical protein